VKASVNQDLCISCGLCVSTCPEVYHWNREEKAEAVSGAVPAEREDCAREAADGCPTDAIETR
jgi:ferredoxin